MSTNGLFRWRGMFSKTEEPQEPFIDAKALSAGIAPAPVPVVVEVRSKLISQLTKIEEHTRQLEAEVAERQERIRQNNVICESLRSGLTVLNNDCQVSKYDVVMAEPISLTQVLQFAEERVNG